MNRRLVVHSLIAALFVIGTLAGGCSDYLDPTQVGRFRPTPVVNVILESLGVAEEEVPVFEGAEEPRPVDVIPFEEDYRFGTGDVVRIAIFELMQEGAWAVNDYLINETGKVSIPEIGQVSARGLTETELENEIKQIVSPSILKQPTVTVTLRGSQSHVFTILGDGVSRPGRVPLPRYPFRLTDALAVAGSVRQFNVSYIYVTRALTGKEALAEPRRAGLEGEVLAPEAEAPEVRLRPIEPEPEPPELRRREEEMMEIIAPYAGAKSPADAILISSSEMITPGELERQGVWPATASPDARRGGGRFPEDGDPVPRLANEVGTVPELFDPLETANGTYLQERAEAAAQQVAVQPQEPARVEWVFKQGRWVPVRVGAEAEERRPGLEPERERIGPAAGGPPPETPEYYGWEQIGEAGVQRRVIKIPVDKLLGGDPRYDIIVKPGDTISVPVDVIGEAWVYGNVSRVGPINITGRPMTLKMAIAAAGGFGVLAWPKRVEVIRRISKNREETVMVDMDKIFKGLQPDFFIKPHDLINVGTHPAARYLAVFRNAFRAA